MPNYALDKITLRRNGVDEPYYIANCKEGYLKEADGKFYKESTYTTEIEGLDRVVYVDLSTNYIYRYDDLNLEFVQIGGSGGASDAIVYVNALPSSDIKDVIYGMITRTSYTETIADDFLDSNTLFERIDGSSSDYTYVPADGAELEASSNGTNYKAFTSLGYDGVSDWTLTYSDGTSDTLADGDTFYFKSVNRNYYAGNKTEQSVTPFASGGAGGGSSYLPGTGIDITNNIISVKPATTSSLGGIKPDDKTVKVDANGELTGNYQGGYGIKITDNEITTKTFVGIKDEWDNLTAAQKAKFDTVTITDDFSTLNNTPGHGIVDSSGTDMPQRSKLQFADATITDDATNDVTIVTHNPYTAGDKIDITNNVVSCDDTVKGTFIGTKDEWNILSVTDKAKYDIVNITDDEITPASVVDTVADGNMNPVTSNAVYDAIAWKMIEVTGDGVKTYTELLNEIATQIGNNPGRFKESKMIISSYTYHNSRDNNYFHSITGTTSTIYILFVYLATTGSIFTQCMSNAAGNTITNLSSTVVSIGTKIQYYYKE